LLVQVRLLADLVAFCTFDQIVLYAYGFDNVINVITWPVHIEQANVTCIVETIQIEQRQISHLVMFLGDVFGWV